MQSLPSLSDVLHAIIACDDDEQPCRELGWRLCHGTGKLNAWGMHPYEVRGYANRCLLPCGDVGHLVKVVVINDDETEEMWVH